MKVYAQWSSGRAFLPMQCEACPRVDEFVMWSERRFRVCQVQYRMTSDGFAPHLILQEQFQ